MENEPFTEEQWIKFAQTGAIMFAECQSCGNRALVPALTCKKCGSPELAWKQTSGIGSVVTYTITTVSPPELCAITPYVAAMVELEEGFRINGFITGIPLDNGFPEDLIGKSVTLDCFD